MSGSEDKKIYFKCLLHCLYYVIRCPNPKVWMLWVVNNRENLVKHKFKSNIEWAMLSNVHCNQSVAYNEHTHSKAHTSFCIHHSISLLSHQHSKVDRVKNNKIDWKHPACWTITIHFSLLVIQYTFQMNTLRFSIIIIIGELV